MKDLLLLALSILMVMVVTTDPSLQVAGLQEHATTPDMYVYVQIILVSFLLLLDCQSLFNWCICLLLIVFVQNSSTLTISPGGVKSTPKAEHFDAISESHGVNKNPAMTFLNMSGL